jgi:steroid 5-alpha reductase family enzyme
MVCRSFAAGAKDKRHERSEMSPLIETMLVTFAAAIGLMTAVWLFSLVRHDASVIDPFWGLGFLAVMVAACAENGLVPRTALLLILVAVWAFRLAVYLLWRNWGHGEDRRYVKMREKHGPRFWWVSLFTVFLLQGVLLWFVSLPLQVAASRSLSTPFSVLDVAGTVIWTVGLLFESVGDWQLARFKAGPANAGRVMDRGLWRYTRHPNYFGDFCVWWGLYLVCVAGGAWWTVLSPILMSILLLKVSGVSLLESTIGERRPDYAAYQARTNSFFPGPPRNIVR